MTLNIFRITAYGEKPGGAIDRILQSSGELRRLSGKFKITMYMTYAEADVVR